MNGIEHPAEKSSTPTGFFATLRAFFAVHGGGMPSRACRRVLVACVAVILGALVLGGTPAMALETHAFSTSFAGEGKDALSDPQGVAVDQSTGEVYVVDGANDRVEIFSATGAFIKAFGAPGSGDGQFKEPTQIAVDNSTGLPGDVYVLDGGNGRVEVFSAAGAYQRQITEIPSILGIAVDSSGNPWIDGGSREVYEFPPGGTSPGAVKLSTQLILSFGLGIGLSGEPYVRGGGYTFVEPEPGGGDRLNFASRCGGVGCGTGIAVDPVNGDVYVDDGASVAHFLAPFSPRKVPLNDAFGSVGPNALVAGAGIAVRGSTGAVYVADSARNRVDVFDPTTLAEATVEAATTVTQTTAELQGTVNPDGIEVQSCEFEWGTGGAFTHTVPCLPAVPYTGSSPIAVEAQLSGLTAATGYEYRLAVTDANGTNHGFRQEQETLATLPAVQGLSTGPAENTTPSAAKLTGSLSPDGTDAHYYFEYSTSTTPESSCTEAAGCFESPAEPGTDAGSGGLGCEPPGGPACSPVSAETTLGGLAANTTYHFRLVGVDAFGTTYGKDATFETPGEPAIDSESAEVSPNTKAGQTKATLRTQITPHGRETTYRFEYGETTSYGTSIPVPPGAIGSGQAPVSVPPAELHGLKVGAAYHYRVVASNVFGTVDGVDQTFATLPAALIEESVADVTSTSATLDAQINPLGAATTYRFEYLTEAEYQADGGSFSRPRRTHLGSSARRRDRRRRRKPEHCSAHPGPPGEHRLPLPCCR